MTRSNIDRAFFEAWRLQQSARRIADDAVDQFVDVNDCTDAADCSDDTVAGFCDATEDACDDTEAGDSAERDWASRN